MRDRPRFELRGALALWSALLAVFSVFGSVRTAPELLHVLNKYGWEFSVCHVSYAYYNPTSFWTIMFTISKVYELGDTLFIVLRKQPLIFLHWYHHVTVLIYVWYSFTGRTASGRWFIVMNYSVHAFMYAYYALKAMRFHIPRGVSMSITTVQILQMVVGTAVNYSAWRAKSEGRYCSVSDNNIRFSFLMYFSYFLLFVHFFYKVYINKTRAAAAAAAAKTQQVGIDVTKTHLGAMNGVANGAAFTNGFTNGILTECASSLENKKHQ